MTKQDKYIFIIRQEKRDMQKTELTLIQIYVRMPQYVVYAIEKYLAISDNTCRTKS